MGLFLYERSNGQSDTVNWKSTSQRAITGSLVDRPLYRDGCSTHGVPLKQTISKKKEKLGQSLQEQMSFRGTSGVAIITAPRGTHKTTTKRDETLRCPVDTHTPSEAQKPHTIRCRSHVLLHRTPRVDERSQKRAAGSPASIPSPPNAQRGGRHEICSILSTGRLEASVSKDGRFRATRRAKPG